MRDSDPSTSATDAADLPGPSAEVQDASAPQAPDVAAAAPASAAPDVASAAPASAAPDPTAPSSTTVAPSADETLQLIRPLAVLAVAALILGRFLAPALPGTLVGMGGFVRAVELAGAILSQLFALLSILGVVLVLLHAQSRAIPLWMRLYAVAVGAFSALVLILGAASFDRVPEAPALLGAALAGAFTLIAAVASSKARVTRLAAAVAALVGAATTVRAVRGFLHLQGALPVPSLLVLDRTAATATSILVAFAAILAIVHISRSSRAEAPSGPADRGSLWTPTTLAVLVLAVLCARQAAVGAAPDAGVISLVLKRASDRFLLPPEPYFRGPVRLFLGFLTPLTAAGLLAVRRVPALGAALCLLLVAADVADTPIGSMTLVLSSLTVLLIARSGHVLWSTLVARPPTAPASY